MNRILFLAALNGMALTGAPSAQAQSPLAIQVANDTLSGGDPVYSIASDLTFTNLSLTENFADGATLTNVGLVAPNGQSSNSLNTTDIFLTGNPFLSTAHGGLLSAILTGGFSATSVGIETAFGGAITPATINSTFTAALTPNGPGDFVNLFATDAASGASYAAGTLALAPAAVPEPGSVALLAACGMTALPFLRRPFRRA